MTSRFEVSQFPAWVKAEAERLMAERQITFDELVVGLVCTHIRSPHQQTGTEFTVPQQIAASLIGDDFMVVRRCPDGVVLTPCEPKSFAEALAEYQEKVSPLDPMFEGLRIE